jgi:hypothetical protein
MRDRRGAALLVVLMLCLGCTASDDRPDAPELTTGHSEGTDDFDIAQPVGDWTRVASGTDGTIDWTVLEIATTKTDHRCLGWLIGSSDAATQSRIEVRQSLLYTYEGVPYSCAPARPGKGFDLMVPLVKEAFPGTDRGLVAGFTTPHAAAVRFSGGAEAMLAENIELAKVFAGVTPLETTWIEVELDGGTTSSCQLTDKFFEPTVLTIC